MSDSFIKKPGNPLAQSSEDPEMYVYLDKQLPDWVTLPYELGGTRANVVSAETGPCPICDDGHPTVHLILDCHVKVVECHITGKFAWCTPKIH